MLSFIGSTTLLLFFPTYNYIPLHDLLSLLAGRDVSRPYHSFFLIDDFV